MKVSLRVALVLSFFLAACGGSEPASSEPITLDQPSNGGEAASDEVEREAQVEGESATPELAIGEDACTTDADCVPADCCHAAACVARDHAPSCGDAVCTTECRYQTIDCGGGCLCHEGHCAARLSSAPNLGVQ